MAVAHTKRLPPRVDANQTTPRYGTPPATPSSSCTSTKRTMPAAAHVSSTTTVVDGLAANSALVVHYRLPTPEVSIGATAANT